MDRAADVGRSAVAGVRRAWAAKVAEALRRDPDGLDSVVELGLVDQRWLDRPGEGPITDATPKDVVQRYLERAVERRPSLLASLGLTALQVLGTEDPPDGEAGSPVRRAVCFTDLEGFTAWTAEHGDAEASGLLAAHGREVGALVRRHRGRVVKRMGDGHLLTFGDARAAVTAALALLPIAPSPLRLRAGVHLGDVVEQRGDVVGHAVNLAARVADEAAGGQVLVTADVADALAGTEGVAVGRVKRVRLRGIAGRVGVAQASAQIDSS